MGNRCAFGALLLLCVLLLTCSAASGGSRKRSKVIVVVANRLLLSDLNDPSLPTISRMLRKGAVGLISPNCAGPKTEASVLLTANAGSPATAGPSPKGRSFVKEFYDANEALPDGTTAGNTYAVRTSRKAPVGSAVFLGLGQALRTNAELNSAPSKLGALGDALHAAGLRTGVAGNADRVVFGMEQPFDRSAAVLAMDSRGIVDYGALRPANELAAAKTQSPPAWTGNNLTPALSSKERGLADLTIVYFGELTRLDDGKMSMSDAALANHQTGALRQLDRLLRELISRAEAANATIILASFAPPYSPAWNELTPIVIYPVSRPGLLAVSTTRTPGLIAASDFAPTVLRLMNLPPSEDMIGRAATVAPQRQALEKLNDINTRVAADQRSLTPVAIFLVALGALTFTPTALIVAFGLRPSRRIVGLLKNGLVVGSTAFAALLLAVLAPAGTAGYIAGTAISIALLTTLCLGLATSLENQLTVRALPVVLAYAATALIIVADALTGCNLCKWSGPSSYQITGMRFYGVGNEYAGVLVSTAALAALFLSRGKWLLPTVGIVAILTLGLGNLGANYGGTAAAVVTFTLLWLAASRGGFGARHVVLAFGLAIAAVVGFAMLDWALAGSAGSHAARATGLTEKLGGGYLASIAMRKVLFNLRIAFSKEALFYALAFVPFLALWFGGVKGKVRTAFKADPRTLAGMKAVLVGAVAAFLLNDSGIIFAGIIMAITMLILLYSLLEKLRVEG